MDISRRLSIPLVGARAQTPTAKPVGRQADLAAWFDPELAFQLLEVIGADSSKKAVRRAIRAWQTIEREAFGDIALGEHLAAGLDARERYLVIFRTLHGECRERAALQLAIDPEVVIDIEHSACLKAATLTSRYHDNLICEPAVLAGAVGQTQREEAVAGHLSTCARCAPEFAARVANVLHHSARFITEREDLIGR